MVAEALPVEDFVNAWLDFGKGIRAAKYGKRRTLERFLFEVVRAPEVLFLRRAMCISFNVG